MPTAAPASSIHTMVIWRTAGRRAVTTPQRYGGSFRSADFPDSTASCGTGERGGDDRIRLPDQGALPISRCR
jgi:hypothetical protein